VSGCTGAGEASIKVDRHGFPRSDTMPCDTRAVEYDPNAGLIFLALPNRF